MAAPLIDPRARSIQPRPPEWSVVVPIFWTLYLLVMAGGVFALYRVLQ